MHRVTPAGTLLSAAALLAGLPCAGQEFLSRCEFRQPLAGTDSGRPVYSARMAESPALDGRLDDAAWQSATPVTGFVEYQVSGNAPVTRGQTTLRFAHTADTLFLAARCEAAERGRIKHDAPAGNRDQDAFGDDCLDLNISIGGNIRQFVLGAGGARMDLWNGDPGWNPAWTAATAVAEDAWTAEIAIPFASLGMSGPGEPGHALRFNVGRAAAPVRLTSSLFPGYKNPDTMGRLVLGTPAERAAFLNAHPGKTVAGVRFLLDKWAYDELDGPARGRLRLLGVATGGAEAPTALHATLTLRAENDPAPLRTAAVGPLTGEIMDFALDSPSLAPGRYVVQVTLTDGAGKILHSAQHPLVRRAAPAAATSGQAPLRVDIPAATAARVSAADPLPVYAGVPFPRGAATEGSGFRLLDRSGREVPCQTEIMSTWSQQGSVRWLGVRFLAANGQERDYTLQYGKAAAAARPPAAVRVESTASNVTVDTGTLRFEVLRAAFDGLHRAWFDANGDGRIGDDEQVLADAPAGGPYVVDHAGRRYYARLDPQAEVSVESAGPLCVVIRAAGWYVAEDGSRVCRHVTRLVAHAGLAWVRVLHTFVFCADSTEVKLADIGWPVALRQASNRFRFGAEPRDWYLSAGGASVASLLQHEADRFEVRQVNAGQAPESGNALVFGCGERAAGWIETTDGRVALAAGLRDFAATYPKELEAESGRIVVHVWPKHGLAPPPKPLTEQNLSELWFLHHRPLLDFQVPEWFSNFKSPLAFPDAQQEATHYRYVRASAEGNGMGVARSSELFLSFRPAARDNVRAVAAFVNAPALAAAAPEWMCRSGAFGPLEPVDRDAFPLVEQALDVRHDGERAIEIFSVGMFNHGGSVSYFNPREKSYQQLERPWRLTHHGSPRVPWLLFARSGDRKFADYAIRHGYWCADIGFCHYSTPEMERLGYNGKVRGGQCDYKGIVPWSSGARVMDYNSMADFLCYMTYFTGDRWPMEVAQEWGACVRERFTPLNARSAAGTLDTLISLYEATWDMDYREMAERQFLHLADNIFTTNGYFKTGNWYDYAPWLAHYHRFTGSDKAADVAVRWSGRLLRDHWLGDGLYGGDTSFVHGMGYPMYDVFRVAYEASRDRRFLDFGLGCALLPALSTVNDPGSLYHGMDTYSTSSTAGYYTQTVPYLLPLLKAHRDELRALFPRWAVRAGRIRLFVADEGRAPLELRLRIDAPPAGAPPFQVSLVSADGQATAPAPVATAHEPVRPDEKAGENRHGFLDYARIALTPERLHRGPVEIVLTPAAGRKDVYVYAPAQLSRPAKLVFGWEKGMDFTRGSALYFRPPPGGDIAVRGTSRFTSVPHMLALLDARDRVRAPGQWYPPESEETGILLRASPPPEDRDAVWCCLQGLSKFMAIEPAADGIPPFFADRPERFFVPRAVETEPSRR